jgi:hypothetical protein
MRKLHVRARVCVSERCALPASEGNESPHEKQQSRQTFRDDVAASASSARARAPRMRDAYKLQRSTTPMSTQVVSTAVIDSAMITVRRTATASVVIWNMNRTTAL